MSIPFFYSFYCPVHKHVPVAKWEWLIANSPLVRRLQRIKQSNFTFLVFQGAVHTRFEHSLGVMHLAWELGKRADSLDLEDLIKLRVAALLHDVGHGPFSHFSDFLIERYGVEGKPLHEKITIDKIKQYNKLFKKADDLAKEACGAKASLTADDVCQILSSDNKSEKVRVLHEILCGDIDIDRMDFLLRDAYFSGIGLGSVDFDFLIKNIEIRKIRKKLAFVIKSWEGVKAAESLLLSRDQLYSVVNYNPRCRFASAVFYRAAEDGIRLGLIPKLSDKKAVKSFMELDDDQFLQKISITATKEESNWAKHAIECFTKNRFFNGQNEVRWVDLHPDIKTQIEDTDPKAIALAEKFIEKKIIDEMCMKPLEVIVDIPPLPKYHEAKAKVHFLETKYHAQEKALSFYEYETQKRVEDVSPIVRVLKESERNFWSICIFTKKKFEAIHKAADLQRQIKDMFLCDGDAEAVDDLKRAKKSSKNVSD